MNDKDNKRKVRIFIDGKEIVAPVRDFKLQFRDDPQAARQPYDLDLTATEIPNQKPAIEGPKK